MIAGEGEQGMLNNEVDKVVVVNEMYWVRLDSMMSSSRGVFKLPYLSNLAA